ncbi:uncharacterized protein LOC109719458 isoform X1 [Ananas comosus]|uniref:Uncharacterized protein LOC109719458 isoform X1 n=2 Tax=Ananas comosus TaxID=4615 RepID=A0A6P5G1M9_ANACO|nr:uncharacterized protein LOC109719458 isoform X1 [Ananas comosus]
MASLSTKIRFVRCPKCLQILVEYPNIPVYKCGGCDAVLRAKNQNVGGENSNSASAETDHPLKHSRNISAEAVSVSSAERMEPFTSNQQFSKVEREEEKIALENSSPNLKNDYDLHDEGETSKHGGVVERGSGPNELGFNSSRDARDDSHRSLVEEMGSVKLTDELEESTHYVNRSIAANDDIVDKVGGESSKLGGNVIEERGSGEQGEHSRPSSRCSLIKEEEGSIRHRGKRHSDMKSADEFDEDVGDRACSDGLDESIRSAATRSSNAYDGSLSSSEDGSSNHTHSKHHLKSRRTFRQKASSVASDKIEDERAASKYEKMSGDAEADRRSDKDFRDDSLKSSRRPPSNHKSTSDRSVGSDEDIVNRMHDNRDDESVKSAASRSSSTYNESIFSSEDGSSSRNTREGYLSKSRRTFRQRAFVANNSNNEKEGDALKYEKRNLSVQSSHEDYYSASVQSFDTRRGASLDSEDFHPMQKNLMGSERGPTFQWDLPQNASSKFKNIETERLARLRKMDVLRDQLSKKAIQREDHQKYHHRDGMNYSGSNHQQRQCFSPNSVSCTHGTYYEQNIRTSNLQIPYNQIPFTPQFSCSCCHFEDNRTSVRDSSSKSSISITSPSVFDSESQKSSSKEKRPAVKNHCRPIEGGAPFVVCYICFNLLHMPTDFLISRKRLNKLRCGSCSEVLKLPFPARAFIGTQTPVEEAAHPQSKFDETIEAEAEAGASNSGDHPRGKNPVSISKEYQISFARSYAEERVGENESGSPLHRLMGYTSASELLYQSRNFDDGYESFESMIPNSYRVSRRAMLENWTEAQGNEYST